MGLFLYENRKSVMTISIQSYPLGPNLRVWLGINEQDYRGYEKGQVNEQEKQEVISYIVNYAKTNKFANSDSLVEIVDELVAMGLPTAALVLVDCNHKVWDKNDFRGSLSEGIASMLIQDLDRAEESFIRAQRLIPEEPAPYINLIKIMLYTDRSKDARLWCETGIEAEPNNHTLWELYYEILKGISPENLELEFKEKITEHNSWSGASLLATISHPDSHEKRLSVLSGFYEEGERSEPFLIEYTGALGAAGEFEKIPQIIWMAKSSTSQTISWKLEIHEAQAYLAMGKTDRFIEIANHIANRKDLPDDVSEQIRELIAEEKSTLN